MNLFLFHWLMLCGWLAFVTPADFSFLRRSSGQQRLLAANITAKTPAG
jgi:hypothetical protein